jgi:hypothetical protein
MSVMLTCGIYLCSYLFFPNLNLDVFHDSCWMSFSREFHTLTSGPVPHSTLGRTLPAVVAVIRSTPKESHPVFHN